MDFQIKPIVTEKGTRIQEKVGQYTFRVSPEANKFQIKDMVEKIYGVKVEHVNTAVMRRKNKSRWTKTGLVRGATAEWKKAYVTLAEGQTIDFFSNI